MKTSRTSRRRKHGLLVFVQIITLLFTQTAAFAEQTGGTVVAGAANIAQAGGNLTVTQTSDRAVINWQAFSVGAGNSANFLLPSSNSAVLNRVTGGSPSAINGSLTSNGQVFLVNPAGIVIGPGANINVGSLVASTLDVSNSEFMLGGDMNFSGSSMEGVVNYGNVEAVDGDIYMIGASVANYGTLRAPNGTVGMAAGQSVLLAESSRPYLKVRATEESVGGTGVYNGGIIDAVRAELIANGGNVYGLAINNTGMIRATGAAEKDGRIFLVAPGGQIESSGDLIAKSGANGGDVIIDSGGTPGSKVTVSGTVDVSGEQNGSVYIKSEHIDIAYATFVGATRLGGNLNLSVGPHSVITDPLVDNGNFLSWNDAPTAPTVLDNSKQIQLTNSSADLNGTGTGVSSVDRTPFEDLTITSADPDNPFISQLTFNLDTAGGPVPSGTIATFEIFVLEPDGTTAVQIITESMDSSTRFDFTAINGELIQKIVINTDDGNGNPVVNQFKQLTNVGVAAGSIVTRKITSPDTDELFTFDASYLDENFTLSNGDSRTDNLSAGTYTMEEVLLPGGWTLDDVTITSNMMGDDSMVDPTTNIATLNLDPGEVIEVVFTNTATGSIIVEKITNPAGSTQVFDFTSPQLGQVSLTGEAGSNQVAYNSIAPGDYSFTETVPTGWELTSVILTDLDTNNSTMLNNGDTFSLDAGQNLKVQFLNTQLGKIIIQKAVITSTPGDEQFTFDASFDFEGSGGSTTMLADGEMDMSGFLSPGSYNVTESGIPEGFKFTEVTGADSGLANPSATIDLQPGETRTVTFFNTELGKIVIDKAVVTTTPGDEQFTFDANFDFEGAGGSTTMLADGEMDMSGFLDPGQYAVTESGIPAGFEFTNISGADNIVDQTAVINLNAGETRYVTFTNTELGKIIVQKSVITTTPGDEQFTFDASFDFEGSGGSTTMLADGEMDMSGFLSPGSYNVTESGIPEGFKFTEVTGADSGLANPSATIDLQPGETRTVTFFNTELGKIVIDKAVVTTTPGDEQFTFDANFDFEGAGGSTTMLADGEMDMSGFLDPGQYAVTESGIPAGFEFTNISGADNIVDQTAVINLNAGETRYVTFTNTELGKIIVQKSVITTTPGDEQFTFDASFDFEGSGGSTTMLADGEMDMSGFLSPGSYDVTESGIPEGFKFTEVTGADSGLANPSATIDLQPGETRTVTFFNTELGKIVIDKAVVTTTPGDEQFTFDANFDFEGAGGSTTMLADGEMDMSGFLDPGQYAVTETGIPAGFEFTNISGADNIVDQTAVINLNAGETRYVTFTNTELGKIIVQKSVITTTPGDEQFTFDADFDFEGSGGSTTMLADGEMDMSGFLSPGSYNVTESGIPEGFKFTEVTGADSGLANPSATIDLQPGETRTVTFFNTELGKIVIDKAVVTTTPGDEQFTFDANFDFEGAGGSTTMLADGEMDMSGFLDPGQYAVTETGIPAGFEFTNISGADNIVDQTAVINLNAGETRYVTFTNTELGKIIVQKSVITTTPGDEQFTFDASFDFEGAGGSTTMLADGEMDMSGFLSPGSYDVTESGIPANFEFTNVAGADSNTGPAATIDLLPGETRTVTFTNTELGKIIVEKAVVTTTPGDEQFTFDADFQFEGSGSTSTMLADGEMDMSGFLSPGSYNVTESGIPANFEFTSVAGADSNTGPAATIDLLPGETRTVTFTNTELGRIVVTKSITNDDPVAKFTFNSDFAAPFELGNDEVFTSDFLQAGTYNLVEIEANGFLFAGLFITDPTGGSSQIGAAATLDLAPGETILADYFNRPKPNNPTPTEFAANFRYDPIYPEGIGEGRPLYFQSPGIGSPDREGISGVDDEITGGSSFDLYR